MKIPFWIYILIGPPLGIVFLLFFPRWTYWDQRIMTGAGLVVPSFLAFLILAVVFYFSDSSPSGNKLMKLGLLALVTISTMVYTISRTKIGF